MASMADLIMDDVEVDDEENDESFDEDTGEARPAKNGVNGHLDDSSEEDEDDDEEEAEAIRKGFIVDEDEEEVGRRKHKHREKKRRREERPEEEDLDEEDIDLIAEANPALKRREPTQHKLKRLKRGHRDDREREMSRGLDEIFSEDDEDEVDTGVQEIRRPGRLLDRLNDEMGDFIEEDDMDDEEAIARREEDREVAVQKSKGLSGIMGAEVSGLSEEALENMRAAFGEGDEYGWALDLERDMELKEATEQQLELKDVFEPSQLAEKLLTDEDNEIRMIDEPERFQVARRPYKHITLTDDQFNEEAVWISTLMASGKNLRRDLVEPFQRAVRKVLEFFVTDELEVPYVFQHRKDHLIHAARVQLEPDPFNPDQDEYTVRAEKLLNQDDLWAILDYDLKFKALIDKRLALQRSYEGLRDIQEIHDGVFEELLPAASTIEELSDIQDYIYFQYASQLKDLNLMNGQINKTQRKRVTQKSLFERIRNGKVYGMVRAFGIGADQVAKNALRQGRRQETVDPKVLPDDMSDDPVYMDASDFTTGTQVLKAAKAMFAEELYMSPRMRKVIRAQYYQAGVMECYRTEKGLKKIDEEHPYYEFKYLRNTPLREFVTRPDMFLRMLKAEEEGLVEVVVRLPSFSDFHKKLYKDIASDNFSEVADAWNRVRGDALNIALKKLEQLIVKSVKENFKTVCEDQIAKSCREEFLKKLDQAPYKPKGMLLGTIPMVLALSCGNGIPGRDAICYVWVDEQGRVMENGKYLDFREMDRERPDFVENKERKAFAALVRRRKPDVIAISGFSAETRRLVNDVLEIIDNEDLRTAEYEDPDTGEEVSKKLEVLVVNDEVARLYQNSPRSVAEYPNYVPLTKYCIGLAKFVQDPMKEYAALEKDIISISFHSAQQLVPQAKILKMLETALVDMVNLCGVDINEAAGDPYLANLLPYVCGLGPRKAMAVLKAININGGRVTSRAELVGDPDDNKIPVVGPRVWNNCASFLYIDHETIGTADYLDNTRVHPEDYELGRKMAADALELDEEDVKAEIDEGGPAAIVKKLIRDDAQEKVNDLILEEYAEQLERNFNQRKRATLETIRAELQQPYEELRRRFVLLSTDEIFTMLTGETRDSLTEGMVIPVSIRRVTNHFVIARLDCGIEGRVGAEEITSAPDIRVDQLFSVGQTVQARILSLSRKTMEAQLSLLPEALRKPYRKHVDHMPQEWDDVEERRDRESLEKSDVKKDREQRVINHPLFHGFNATEAEQFLASRSRGDAVIRTSSKGMDHIAVTWKVSDNIYQHIDVLELNKDNDFTVGKKLTVSGKYSYTDLDELINQHVKEIARKVDEMTLHDKYHKDSKTETEKWLTTYTEANPHGSVYAFCIDPRHPGYFFLCFKAGLRAKLNHWSVKCVPKAYELRGNLYPDMRALCNGFKKLFGNLQAGRRV
ncbi:MAG: Transcription elongation factor spt6 [Vezdaea aestivalis]|nr:MAG: Transcription elongation factor spt6 [Vezdaea aestivalis]